MNLTLVKEYEVPLLSRKRVTFSVEYPKSATPKEADITKSAATLLKTQPECIKVQHIYPRYGETKAKIIAHVYNSPEDLMKIETINKKKKVEKK